MGGKRTLGDLSIGAYTHVITAFSTSLTVTERKMENSRCTGVKPCPQTSLLSPRGAPLPVTTDFIPWIPSITSWTSARFGLREFLEAINQVGDANSGLARELWCGERRIVELPGFPVSD